MRGKSNSYPGEKGGKQIEGKKKENEGMRENKVSLCTHLLFNQKQRKQVLEGRDCSTSPPPCPSTATRNQLWSLPAPSSQSRVSLGPCCSWGAGGDPDTAPQEFPQDRAEPRPRDPTITWGPAETSPLCSTAEGTCPTPRPALLPVLIMGLQQHSSTGSSMPYIC